MQFFTTNNECNPWHLHHSLCSGTHSETRCRSRTLVIRQEIQITNRTKETKYYNYQKTQHEVDLDQVLKILQTRNCGQRVVEETGVASLLICFWTTVSSYWIDERSFIYISRFCFSWARTPKHNACQQFHFRRPCNSKSNGRIDFPCIDFPKNTWECIERGAWSRAVLWKIRHANPSRLPSRLNSTDLKYWSYTSEGLTFCQLLDPLLSLLSPLSQCRTYQQREILFEWHMSHFQPNSKWGSILDINDSK